MPETYTQEQISEAVRECDRFAEKHYDKEIAPYVEILSYALSTAERERDAYRKAYYNVANERTDKQEELTAVLSERDALAARCAELEAIPDRLRKLDISLCPEPHGEWSLLDGEKEIAFFGDSIESVIKQAEAAIVGKKEG